MASEGGDLDTAVQDDNPKTEQSSISRAKLFLGGLSWNTDEDTLRNYFSKYGEIEDVVVMRDRGPHHLPRGFGFVTFKTPEAAEAACKETHKIDERTIDAKPSVPQGEGQRPRSKKIFVGGLPADLTEDQFKEHFRQFGVVIDANIMMDHKNGRSRGFGFITFDTEECVQEVLKAGSMQKILDKAVEVKSATPKGSGPIIAHGTVQRGVRASLGAPPHNPHQHHNVASRYLPTSSGGRVWPQWGGAGGTSLPPGGEIPFPMQGGGQGWPVGGRGGLARQGSTGKGAAGSSGRELDVEGRGIAPPHGALGGYGYPEVHGYGMPYGSYPNMMMGYGGYPTPVSPYAQMGQYMGQQQMQQVQHQQQRQGQMMQQQQRPPSSQGRKQPLLQHASPPPIAPQ